METREVLIPQMGEGLQEVRILAFAKQPGDSIERDEILYTMETDKAAMQIESPFAGDLVEWLAAEGSVLPVGAPIARVAIANEQGISGNIAERPAGLIQGSQHRASERPQRISPLSAASGGDRLIPPRTRAYSRELGLSEDELRSIHAPTGKLMPADVDAYLIKRSGRGAVAGDKPSPVEKFTERPLSADHRTFVMRIRRSQALVVPAVIRRSISWSTVRRVAEARKLFGALQPSAFQTFAYAVSRSVHSHPKLRSTMPTDDTVHEYEHLNLGIAVGLAGGQLNVAVVPSSDTLGYDEFVTAAQQRIDEARAGRDQANESVQLLLTYMGGYEIDDAIPLLVAPAVAILFVGSAYDHPNGPRANITLTFDHRLIQGVEAAGFLKTIAAKSSDPETWRSDGHGA